MELRGAKVVFSVFYNYNSMVMLCNKSTQMLQLNNINQTANRLLNFHFLIQFVLNFVAFYKKVV